MNAALDDREERLRPRRAAVRGFPFQPLELLQTAAQPAQASLAGVARGGVIGLAGDHVVELHDHVSAQVALDPHHRFGGEVEAGAVHMAAELHAVLAHLAQRGHTWKPPESVRMGPSHCMKLCSPPSSRTNSSPGRWLK